MQTFMLKLDRWLGRHRRAVIGFWLVLLLAALPFAAKQSDHLSSGGYAIPGSQSQRFVAQLPKVSAGAPHGLLAGVLEAKAGASATEMTQALARLDNAAAGAANVSLSPTVRAQAQHAIDAAGARQRTLVVPLTLSVNEDQAGARARKRWLGTD